MRYQPARLAGYALHLRRRRGLPWPQVLVQCVLHAGLRRGDAEQVSRDFEDLVGRMPTLIEDVVARIAARWREHGSPAGAQPSRQRP